MKSYLKLETGDLRDLKYGVYRIIVTGATVQSVSRCFLVVKTAIPRFHVGMMFLCLTIHICHSTALVVFSLYTRRDIDSDDSHARPLIHACAQPIFWFERERKLRAGHRADTLQTW